MADAIAGAQTRKLDEDRKAVMIEHLRKFGFPHSIKSEVVLRELPAMWKLLDEADLIKGEFTFQRFEVSARTEFMRALINDAI